MDAFDNKNLRPMLIGKAVYPFDDDGYIFELKLDGVRCLAYLDETGTVLAGRRGGKLLPNMPELAGLHKQVDRKCILDGELVAAADGALDFEAIKQRALISDRAKAERMSRKAPATFVAFDILYADGELLTGRKLTDRKKLLADTVTENERISVSRYIEGQGIRFFDLVRRQGLEGIVGKKKDSKYYPNQRTKDWVKIKNVLDDDFVICGYVQNSPHVISVVLGQYDQNKRLLYMGRAALRDSRDDFTVIQQQNRADGHPFGEKPPAGNKNAVWLEPNLVCVVAFINRTAAGRVRQPVFKGIRADKTPEEAVYRARGVEGAEDDMAERLGEYNQKRRFGETGEPRGGASKKSPGQLRFVVQRHMATRDHYDFRLEWDGVLKSWAVPKGPSYDSHEKRLAVRVEDHPLEYRGFEGTIPKGQYGGGSVMIWDEGTWEPLEDAGKGFAEGSLKFTLEGSRMLGKWALVRMRPKPDESGRNWLLVKEKDRFENAYDVRRFQTSVKTGRTMAEIEKGETGDKMSDRETAKTRKPPSNGKKQAREAAAPDVEITHPDKVLYGKDGITKGDIAAYYRSVSARMMPYVENRIISTVRCPGGIDSACFFKRHPSNEKGVFAVPVTASDGETKDYYYVTDVAGLLSEVQMNALEFHTWGSRVGALEQPDIMVFDLDPDAGMDLGKIRQGVRDLKSLLDQLSLVSYLKTSGGKGYHIVIPFRPWADWDSFHRFAKNIAKTMEATWPDRYTSNVRKEKRKGRIFIDWIRNGRGATSVAPYSVRAREGAPVSMPIAWEELDAVAPPSVTVKNAEERLRREDPWKTFFQNDQQLK